MLYARVLQEIIEILKIENYYQFDFVPLPIKT